MKVVRPLKVLVLYYDMRSEAPDVVATQVQDALRVSGHEVVGAGVHSDIDEIVAPVRQHKPDIVFNLCETFNEDPKLEANVAAVLELMGQPFTGAGQVGLILAQNKVLTKMVIAAYGVRAPSYAVFYPDRVEVGEGTTRFPLMVKPSSMDASIGIANESVVRDWDSLLERVRYVQEELADAALVEEFIDGREFYAGVVGNRTPQPLPVLEMTFKGYEKGKAKIVTSEAKWDASSEDFKKTTLVRPRRLPSEVEASIQRVAVQAFRACHLRDYGRVDMRVRRGKPFVLEVNPNPYLAIDAELATAAKEQGQDYGSLIDQILETAWRRYNRGEPA